MDWKRVSAASFNGHCEAETRNKVCKKVVICVSQVDFNDKKRPLNKKKRRGPSDTGLRAGIAMSLILK